ncbi:hypothetical protein GEMRC1_010524 [Eukaryota sp. GEM-RC1]
MRFSLSSDNTLLVFEPSTTSWKVSCTDGKKLWTNTFSKTDSAELSQFILYTTDPSEFEKLLGQSIQNNHSIKEHRSSSIVVSTFTGSQALSLTLNLESTSHDDILPIFFSCLKAAKSEQQFHSEPDTSASVEPKSAPERRRSRSTLPGIAQKSRRRV